MKIDDRVLRADSNNFTLVRLILACSVIYSHAFWATTGQDTAGAQIFGESLGGGAVEGFFFLSGFLVYASLLRMKSSLRFVLARLSRLWPGLAVCVSLTMLAGWGLSSVRDLSYFRGATIRFLFDNLSLIRGAYELTGIQCGAELCNVNVSLWSLPWEVRCYAILALLGLSGMASQKWMAIVFIPATVLFALAWDIAPVRDFVAAKLGRGAAFQIDVFHRLWPLFTLGIAAYIFRGRIVLSWWALGALFLASLALQNTEVALQARSVLIGYGVLCVGLLTARRRPVSSAWPDYSYGIYIYAFPLMALVHGLWPRFSVWPLSALTLAVTLPVAAASWHFVEKPALSVARRWTSSRRGPALNPISAAGAEAEAAERSQPTHAPPASEVENA